MTVEKYKEIYEMLDTVDPVPFDCGRICGAACCQMIDEETGIYLLPGEECIRDRDEWAFFERETSRSTGSSEPAAASMGKSSAVKEAPENGYIFVGCRGPEHCERSTRPIQCRTFPLFPEISPDGEMILSINSMDLPYSCPLIESNVKLNPDFVEKTGQAWRELLKDKDILDLVQKLNEA